MDIKCRVCAEPWDWYGLRNGDVEKWEHVAFKQGKGCPCCKGSGDVQTSKVDFAESLARVSDGCPMTLLDGIVENPLPRMWYGIDENDTPIVTTEIIRKSEHECGSCGCQAAQVYYEIPHKDTYAEEGEHAWVKPPPSVKRGLYAQHDWLIQHLYDRPGINPLLYMDYDPCDESEHEWLTLNDETWCRECADKCYECDQTFAMADLYTLPDTYQGPLYCVECSCEVERRENEEHDTNVISRLLEIADYDYADVIVMVEYSDGSSETRGCDVFNVDELCDEYLRDIVKTHDPHDEFSNWFHVVACDANGWCSQAAIVPSSRERTVVSARIFDEHYRECDDRFNPLYLLDG